MTGPKMNPSLPNMSTRNPLSYDGIQPIANMGTVPGKVMLDTVKVAERMADAKDPDTMQRCIPGGAEPENHAILWGDPVFGLKCIRNGAAGDGEPNELVTASLAGENLDHYGGDVEALEEEYYFAGFSVDNYYLADPNTGANPSHSPPHGVATVRVGTQSTRNNGPLEFFPGQKITYRCPKTLQTAGGGRVMAETGSVIVKRTRVGEPNTRPRFELVPFDYTDFSTQIAGAYHALQRDNNGPVPGIANVPFSTFEQRNERTNVHTLSSRLEAAGGRQFGDFGFVLAVIETLALRGLVTINGQRSVSQLAEAMGLWSTNIADKRIILEAYRNAYFQDLPLTTDVEDVRNAFLQANGLTEASARNVISRDNSRNDPAINYQKLRLQLSRFKDGALVADLWSKTSKIIGTALNNAEPTQTLHVMAGHTPV